jgi:ABC-type sugar transport system substrate-binding protein
MHKKLLLILAANLFLAFAVPGSVLAQGENLRVAFSVPGLNFPFFRLTAIGAEQAAERLGNIELVVLDGQDSDAVQLSTAENAVARGIDAMVISPRTQEGLASLFALLEEQNIPVVTFDRRSNAESVLAHVGADNVAGGRRAGEFVAERLGNEGRVIELLGTPGASPAIDRSKGFNEAIAEHPDIERVAQQTGNFNSADALRVTEDILTRLGSTPEKPGFDALFAANDDMALGAVEAIRARGLDPANFVIVGFDALNSALELIEQGDMTATIDQFPNRQAATALEGVVSQVRNGETPEDDVIMLEPEVITQDNLDEASTLLLDEAQ